ncbi:MAG: Rieske 2Fe-2S domain-containing protein [Planctomycetia bacterium]|nr:Rieske 2Fe-2S domain-containing protein [Planctomycetia bacterium]
MNYQVLPLNEASTIPSLWYTSPEIYQKEKALLWNNTWIYAGRTDQVTKPGDFLTVQIADEPILVIRGEDGILRSFINVCRHRAARVVTTSCGHTDRLRCPYHGWTYDLSGQLRGVPEFDGVTGFKREENGLPVVHVDTWGPLVFVHLGKPAIALTDALHPMPEKLQAFNIEQLRCVGQKEYILQCNWKVFIDNYLDGGYHVNAIHPSLAGVLDYKNYKTECFKYTSVQSSPLRAPQAGDDQGAAQVRTGQAAAYWWIFPNLMLNAYEGVMDTNVVYPMGPDRCRVVFDFYFHGKDQSPEAIARQTESMKVADLIQAEDVGICEDVQRGLLSQSFDTGRYSVRREQGVHHFHSLLACQLQMK